MNEDSFSPSTKRGGRRKSPEKRKRILKAATKVFAQKGFHGARVTEIARAAGVAEGTIYLYFKNKEDLLVSLFETHVSQLNEELRETLKTLPDSPTRLRYIVDCQLGQIRDSRELAEVLSITLRQSNRFLRQFAAPRFTEYLEVISQVVEEGQRPGEIRRDVTPLTVARALFGALDGLLLTWALGRAPASRLERAGKQVADVIVQGLRPDGTA